MTSPRDLAAELAADLASCLVFFSRLPVPSAARAASACAPLARAIRVLPVAGLLIGACPAFALLGCVLIRLPPLLCVIVAGLVAVLVAGGLHEDGLADTADGLGGGATRERKLAIMRDSRIGSFGVLALAMALLWRLAALSAIVGEATTRGAVAVLLGTAVLSRPLALLPLALLSPAREDGLGRGVGVLERGPLALCFGTGACLALVLPVAGGIGLGHAMAACLLAPLAAAAMTALAWRQIGGHTGDIAGACQQVAEAAYLGGLLLFPPLGR